MTTDTTASTAANDASSDASRQGPGRLIRLARERARLQLSELASLTKLTTSTLEALERDDFNILNEPVYVRGYYRKCAKALVINEQELIGAYEKLVRPRAPQAPTKLLIGSGEGKTGLKSSRGAGGGVRWLWIVVIGGLLGLAFWFLHEDPNARHVLSSASAPAEVSNLSKPSLAAPAAPADTAAAPAAAAPAGTAHPLSTNELSTTPAESGQTQAAAEPAQDNSPTPAHASPGSGLTMSESVSPAPAAQAPASSAAAPAPAASSAAAGPDSLILDFKGTSWVRVEDSSGKLLMSGMIQSGDHQVVTGKPPYSIFVGNAPGVSLQYQGQPIDLTPYTKSNATARLSVPAGQ
jgi:cytoskeleton protein RodZ